MTASAALPSSPVESGAFERIPSRPVLRWHGGKWRLAPWIISHFGPHRVYVEPYGGAASVLLRKPRAYAEVYNDLDDEAVNLFRVLRDPDQAARLIRLLALTPFARTEFESAYEASAEPIERARRLIICAFMGHGSDGPTSPYRTGFRANSKRSGTTPAHDWVNYAPALPAIVERLSGVIIERREATAVMAGHDAPTTLHFVDPPYLHSTRAKTNRRPGGGAVPPRADRRAARRAARLPRHARRDGRPLRLSVRALRLEAVRLAAGGAAGHG